MKKLLSILSAMTLIGTTSTSVIACGTPDSKKDTRIDLNTIIVVTILDKIVMSETIPNQIELLDAIKENNPNASTLTESDFEFETHQQFLKAQLWRDKLTKNKSTEVINQHEKRIKRQTNIAINFYIKQITALNPEKPFSMLLFQKNTLLKNIIFETIALTPEQISWFKNTQIRALNIKQITALTPEQFQEFIIPYVHMVMLKLQIYNRSRIMPITPEQITEFSSEVIEFLKEQQLLIKLQNIETIKQLNLDSNSGYDTISPTISDSVSKILNKIKKTEMKNFNT